jgi:hypothetical protein
MSCLHFIKRKYTKTTVAYFSLSYFQTGRKTDMIKQLAN